MMENVGYLVAAYAIVWLAIAGYLAWLGVRLDGLRRDVATLRRLLDGDPAAEG